jgi:hypothetical protein
VRKYGFQTFGIYFIKIIVIVVIVIIFSLKQQVENDNTNDGIPLISENAVQNLMLNLPPAMFTSYSEISPAGWDRG